MSMKLNQIHRELRDRIERQMREEDAELRPCAPFSPLPVTDEIEQLHKPIIKWLNERNWPYDYSNPTKPTRSTVGWPDFRIMCPNGKMLFIECKKWDGQLTKEQDALRKRAAELGHYIHIVRSWQEFSEAVSKIL